MREKPERLGQIFADAFDKFTVGQRVVTTSKALKNGVVRKETFGRVTGISDGYPHWTVFVLKDGRKHAIGYHMDFWAPTRRRSATK